MRLYIGTYPHGKNDLRPEGVWSANIDLATAQIGDFLQLNEVASPSFIALSRDADSLLVVSESSQGNLWEFPINSGGLGEGTAVVTRGADPCHVIAPAGLAIVANYSSGSVFAHRIPLAQYASEGSGQKFQQAGSGPHVERQEGPHAHFAGVVPGTQYVWVSDLGADQISLYAIGAAEDGQARLEANGVAVKLPAGAGPRHIAFTHGNRAYVVGELSNVVYSVEIDPGTGQGTVVAETALPVTKNFRACGGQVIDPGTIEGLEGDPIASHIELSPDGKRLYVTVRVADVLAVFDIADDGSLSLNSACYVGGHWPRHFRVLAGEGELEGNDIVVIAVERSSVLTTFAFNPASPELVPIAAHDFPVPACIVPA